MSDVRAERARTGSHKSTAYPAALNDKADPSAGAGFCDGDDGNNPPAAWGNRVTSATFTDSSAETNAVTTRCYPAKTIYLAATAGGGAGWIVDGPARANEQALEWTQCPPSACVRSGVASN